MGVDGCAVLVAQEEPGEGAAKSGMLRRAGRALEQGMRGIFFRIGYFVAGRPWTVILVGLLISLGAIAGVLRLESESRSEKLWVPQRSRAQGEKLVVEEGFGSFRRFSEVLFVAREKGGDIASRQAMLDVVDVMAASENVLGEPVDGGSPPTFQERCFVEQDAKGNTYCSRTSALDLFYDPEDVVEVDGVPDYFATVRARISTLSDKEVKEVLLTDDPVRTFYSSPLVLGSLIARDGDKVTALRVQQVAQNNLVWNNGKEVDEESDAWEAAFAAALNGGSFPVKSNLVRWETDTVKGQEESLDEALTGDLGKLAVGIAFLVLYVVLFMGEFHAVHSRMVLGVIAIAIGGLSLGVTFGLCSLVGWFYGPVHNILPLLILGISVDDMFVITRSMNDLNRKDPHMRSKDLPTRIGLAVSKSGTAITVTSFTNFLVFLVSSVSRLPALRFFSLWASVGVVVDFSLSITVFVAALTLDQRRIDANRRDLCACLPAVKEPEEKNWFRLKFGVFNRFFSNFLGPFILTRFVRLVLLTIFAGLLAAGAYGCSKIYLKFEFSFFYPANSDQRNYADTLDEYFEKSRPSFVYVRRVDVSTAESQQKLLTLCATGDGVVAKNKGVEQGSVNCWYEALRESEGVKGSDTIPSGEFSTKLTKFLDGPGAQYAGNIVREDDGSINISRFSLMLLHVDSIDEEIERLESMREDVTKAEFTEDQAFPYDFDSIYTEQFIALPGEVLLTLLLSTVSVGVVTFVLIGNPVVGLISMLVVGFIITDVVGFMHFSGFNLNSVSVILLSVSVGFSCDSVVHVARSFIEQVGTRKERTIAALDELGPPVFHAAFSTFLAIMALSVADSYIFQSLFSGFASLLILASAHGLILLPILLSLVGPDGFYKTLEEKEADDRRLEEKLLSVDCTDKCDI